MIVRQMARQEPMKIRPTGQKTRFFLPRHTQVEKVGGRKTLLSGGPEEDFRRLYPVISPVPYIHLGG